MNRLHDERDEEEEVGLPDVLFGEDQQDEEFDGPCKECGGDEDDVRLVDSLTMTHGEPDPKIALCEVCRSAHEAFYAAAAEYEEGADDDTEVDPSQLD